jgi:hypothetical protein
LEGSPVVFFSVIFSRNPIIPSTGPYRTQGSTVSKRERSSSHLTDNWVWFMVVVVTKHVTKLPLLKPKIPKKSQCTSCLSIFYLVDLGKSKAVSRWNFLESLMEVPNITKLGSKKFMMFLRGSADLHFYQIGPRQSPYKGHSLRFSRLYGYPIYNLRLRLIIVADLWLTFQYHCSNKLFENNSYEILTLWLWLTVRHG